jgi:hypothetical protein
MVQVRYTGPPILNRKLYYHNVLKYTGRYVIVASPDSHRRKLQNNGEIALRLQPIAKKYEIPVFLFFPLVHTESVRYNTGTLRI